MTAVFYISGAVAVIAAALVVLRANAMHALLSLVTLFIAVSGVFYSLGAPFVAVLQIVIYAGAIMVLFVFVVMMLNLGHGEGGWLHARRWAVPSLLALVLLLEIVGLTIGWDGGPAAVVISPKEVGVTLFTRYLIGVELASMLLLAALVAAFHFGFLRGRLEGADE